MSKIFRLESNVSTGVQTWKDWDCTTTTPYDSKTVSNIIDPDGATKNKEITSIPSPFARIDLVKLAFDEVNKSEDLDGNSIYHKMVSDALDIGEIFFNFNKLTDKVEIIKWERKTQLEELFNSPDKQHQIYVDALEKYLKADSNVYNFGDTDKIYILNYIGPDAPSADLNVIGATSPATLFFSNANDLSYISKHISFGQDKPFDTIYQPLYKRDFDYVKLWYILKREHWFATAFPEIDEYLNLTEKRFSSDSSKMKELRDANPTDYDNYQEISINTASRVEILGHPLYQRKQILPEQIKSDFIINSNITKEKIIVLPIESGTKYSGLVYTTDKWGDTCKAPIKDDSPLQNRKLPFDRSSIPYLTISDFLEDSIICVPHKFESRNFFNGNFDKVEQTKYSYLLPIKSSFFNYFTVEELQGEMKDGKKMFEMNFIAGDSIKVIIRIPIIGLKGHKSNYIEYNRNYFRDSEANITEDSNFGGIIEDDFVLALYPNIKYPSSIDPYYSIGIVSEMSSNNHLVCFFKGNSPVVSSVKLTCNDRKFNDRKTETFYIDSAFDYISLKPLKKITGGLIIPAFKGKEGKSSYHFAVDLGTSNTHIEYLIDGYNDSKAFDITTEDIQITHLFDPGENFDSGIFDQDFIPEQIGNKSKYYFPMRTVYSVADGLDKDIEYKPFINSNIPFTFDKMCLFPYNSAHTNIKWDNDVKITTAYIESIILLLRNKVLLNNGDLNSSTITWFYPISMSQGKFNQFKSIWDKLFDQYFNNNLDNLNYITESIAPSKFFIASNSNVSDIVSIDIGGGTTDVVHVNNQQIQYITSFRFAANSIFGDGFITMGSNKNKMINYYGEKISNSINGLFGLSQVYNDLRKRGHSVDIASFLFSLNSNKDIQNSKIDKGLIDFGGLLQRDDKYKIVFLFFFTALIYHIASIAKAKNLDAPRHIAFSGNGSNIIKILSPSEETLSNYVKLIFEKVLNKKYSDNWVVIILQKNPKEATCKGGLAIQKDNKINFSVAGSKKVVLKASDNKTFIEKEKYEDISNNSTYINCVHDQIVEFLNFFFNLNNDFSFVKNFVIKNSSLDIFQECRNDIDTYIKNGLEERINEIGANSEIEETSFFYPITGIINYIINNI